MDQRPPLDIAAKTYYWKPSTALFRALEFRAYTSLSIKICNPTLDLGCGDGSVANVLKKMGFIEAPLCGLDITLRQAIKAKETSIHHGVLQADANRLPFKDNSFESVFSNGVLCAIPGGAEGAISEVARVLRQGQIFVATVPTNDFIDMLLLPKIFKVFSNKLALRYIRKLNHRLDHHNGYFSPEEWIKQMEANGFSVEKIEGFFSKKAGYIYSVVNLQLFRVFGILRIMKNGRVTEVMSRFLIRAYRKIYERDKVVNRPFGYMIILARKT